MININNYIRMINFISILDYMKVCDEIVYINPVIYTRIKDDIGESTIDTAIRAMSGGKEYAGYLGITVDRDDWYKWHEETHTYSNSMSRTKEACNKHLDEIIQKIQDAVSKAKKRHSEFTEIIELD